MAKRPNPETRAQQVLDELGLDNVPINVERVAKLLGAKVRYSPFDEELSGMIHIKDGMPIILVNSLHHPNRQRFTIAHEVGHLELHRDMITAEVHVDKNFAIEFRGLRRDQQSGLGTVEVEIQANRFGAALLMPAQILESELEGKQFDIDDEAPLERIARKFKVSKQALEYRIRNLGLTAG